MCWQVWGTMANQKDGFTNQKQNEMEKQEQQEINGKMISSIKTIDKWEDRNNEGGMMDLQNGDGAGDWTTALAHLGRAAQRRVRTAHAGRRPVGRRPPGWGPRSPVSVAETGHDLCGALREDELLPQLHVGPAFSWETTHKREPLHGSRLVRRWWSWGAQIFDVNSNKSGMKMKHGEKNTNSCSFTSPNCPAEVQQLLQQSSLL